MLFHHDHFIFPGTVRTRAEVETLQSRVKNRYLEATLLALKYYRRRCFLRFSKKLCFQNVNSCKKSEELIEQIPKHDSSKKKLAFLQDLGKKH